MVFAPRHCIRKFALPLIFGVSSSVAFSLHQAFASPSGKLTYSPELVIPDPKDPTAILLLSNAVQTLSGRIRAAQANSAFVDGSISALRTFCNEQSQAEGNFPGPVPVVYCGKEKDYTEVRNAGAKAVLLPLQSDSVTDPAFLQRYQEVVDAGLYAIPELTLLMDSINDDSVSVEEIVATLEKATGGRPKALIITPPVHPEVEEGEEPMDYNLPTVPKQLGKEIPVLGSVRATAGENRLSAEASKFKEAGFTGIFLRSDCVPGFRMQPDLEIVSSFWQAVITDLKSTRSKSFGFRSKNNMDVSATTKWGNYQKNIMESGALGDPDDSYSIVDSGAGEYKGFA